MRPRNIVGFLFFEMVKVKANELRKKEKEELLKDLRNFKQELLDARTAASAGTTSNKLSQIRFLRKSIARVLTVYNEKRRYEAKLVYLGKKYIPKDLRPKTTRAMRRRMSHEQANKNTVKAEKKASNFPRRRYALTQPNDEI